MVLSEVAVDIVAVEDEARFRDLMQAHHYLGAVPGMGETVRYAAHHRGRWLALAVFSAPALKCGARDRWIGWDLWRPVRPSAPRHQQLALPDPPRR